MLARVLLVVVFAGLALGGCEKADHDTIDKWTHTQKGPDKLRKALADESLDAELSAHAAANMIKMGADPDVRAALEAMSEPRRAVVIAKLAPRMWKIARIENDTALPGPTQIIAKDALISLRKYADAEQKQQIDTYLIDWYAVDSYEGRAQVGSTLGGAVMRMIGPAAAKKMMSVANHVIVAPGQEKVKNRIGNDLMLGMAATGSPDAAKYLIDIAKMDRGDKTLAVRAMNQLYKAYVDPGGLFDMTDPSGLVPNVDALIAFAKDENMPGQAVNDAIELVRAAGSTRCFEPLVTMIPYPHREPRFRYATAYAALQCGGTKAILQVVRALPDSATYAKEDLVGAVAGVIAKMSPRDQVQAAARQLLKDNGRVAKWVAIEALAAMKSTEDIPRIAALAGSSERLVGFWGDQSGKNPKDRQEDLTLGQRARQLADKLAKPEAPK